MITVNAFLYLITMCVYALVLNTDQFVAIVDIIFERENSILGTLNEISRLIYVNVNKEIINLLLLCRLLNFV